MPDAQVYHRALPDGRVRFRLQYRIRGRIGVRTFSNEQAASRWLAVFKAVGAESGLAMLDARTDTDAAPTVAVADAVAAYIDERSGITAGTREGYRREARRDILPDLGPLPVVDVDRARVARWVNGLHDRGLSGKTIANRHALLSAAFTWAVEAGHVMKNPCRGVKLPTSIRRAPVFLTPAEVATLLDVIDPRYRDLILVVVGTGLRWGEVTALRRRHLEVDGPILRIRVEQAWKDTDSGPMVLGPPKSARGRRAIPLGRPSPVADALERAAAAASGGGWLFTSPRGEVLRNGTFHARVWIPLVRRLVDEHGWAKRPSVHDLRHTAASLMIAAGEEIHAVSAILGHEKVSTTVDIYGHFRPGARESALRALGGALSAALEQNGSGHNVDAEDGG